MNNSPAFAIFARLDPPLWLLTSQAGEQRGGLIATFVNQASLPPDLPRVVVGLARHHFTWGLVEASSAFVLHLLGEEQLPWVWRFGLQSGHETDKLRDLTLADTAAGSPCLVEAQAWLACRVEARLDTGDRTLYLAEVVEAELQRSEPVLTMKHMLELAPEDRRRELKKQMQRDQAIDAVAIRSWRQSRRSP
jgi:flavin reductase (DIM6/NTAB) family NADH-FMN oxidoreductase RutF